VSEIIAASGGGSGAVQRELASLASSGLANVQQVGNQKLYQANSAAPIYAELVSIMQKTTGLAEPLRVALAPLANSLTAAFVYGSVAKRSDTASSDIDLMIVSDTLSYADVFGAVEIAAQQLGRAVNPTVYTRAELVKRIKSGNAFVTRVLEQPQLWLLGDKDDLST
ncbi:MAG TPA: nucleotidyltransferase domain-containing protein, partial [Rhodanobacter sp.]|jgi:predicted nucleotidyltransferase